MVLDNPTLPLLLRGLLFSALLFLRQLPDVASAGFQAQTIGPGTLIDFRPLLLLMRGRQVQSSLQKPGPSLKGRPAYFFSGWWLVFVKFVCETESILFLSLGKVPPGRSSVGPFPCRVPSLLPVRRGFHNTPFLPQFPRSFSLSCTGLPAPTTFFPPTLPPVRNPITRNGPSFF